MSPAWHTITVPDAPPRIAATLAALGTGAYDGHVGIVRIGAYPDVHEEEFVWSSADARWVGAREYVVLSALDAWAMAWDRTPSLLLRNKWARPSGGVSWQIVGPHGQLDVDVALPQSSIVVKTTDAYSNFSAAGQFLLQDVLVTYTGLSYVSATGLATFTGCTNDGAHDGRGFYGQHTAVIPYGSVNGGDQGGWGTSVQALDRVGDLWTAGFRLEERLDGFFNGTTDLTAVQFAPFYLNTDANEDLGAAANYPGIWQSADTVPNLLGPGITVLGPAYDLGGYSVPGNHQALSERGFERRTTAWTAWAAGAPNKRFLQPLLYAKHDALAKGNGQCYSVNLMLRYTGTP